MICSSCWWHLLDLPPGCRGPLYRRVKQKDIEQCHLPVSFSPHWEADKYFYFWGFWRGFVRIFSVWRNCVILVILLSYWHHHFVLYFLVLSVHGVLLCLSLQLDIFFTPAWFFSHVLHKNAAVVMQTNLALLHFLFLLDYGARISCAVSIAWSPFVWSACHSSDITHLLHLMIVLFLSSCGISFWVFSVVFLWDTITILPYQQRNEVHWFR